jgi:hypothetical protein
LRYDCSELSAGLYRFHIINFQIEKPCISGIPLRCAPENIILLVNFGRAQLSAIFDRELVSLTRQKLRRSISAFFLHPI